MGLERGHKVLRHLSNETRISDRQNGRMQLACGRELGKRTLCFKET